MFNKKGKDNDNEIAMWNFKAAIEKKNVWIYDESSKFYTFSINMAEMTKNAIYIKSRVFEF